MFSPLLEMIEFLCDINGIDFIEFQQNMMQDEKVMQKFYKLIPEKVIDKAA